jgi:hypothetical protein
MSGKVGQRSGKASEIPARYTQEFLKAMDRRTKAARAQRAMLQALLEECGGAEALELTELETVRRFAHLCRRIGRIEESEISGQRIDQPSLNDSTRSWLGLLRQFQLIKVRRRAGACDPLAALFAEEPES